MTISAMTISAMTISTLEGARRADSNDPLRDYRSNFELPKGVIYLDGNSLGPPPRNALDRLQRTAQHEWREGLITSWNQVKGSKAGWIDLPKQAGAKIAAIIGADERDVIVADSVSVNIFKLAAALLQRGQVGAIAYERGEFPTDGYILQGLARLTGARLIEIEPDDKDALATENISVLIKSVAHYKSAIVADVAAWETAAQSAGTAMIWDLSHGAGVLKLDLQDNGARFAVGCGYKYLNGGPGAPAYLYVDTKEANTLDQPLSGWMGHAAPFDFSGTYAPAAGIERFACGTPPILSLAALDASLDLFDGISLEDVENKATALGNLFVQRANALGLTSISPQPGERRGGHISLEHDHGYALIQALIEQGVIGDFRAPSLMRFGFSPLFLQYTDVYTATEALAQTLATQPWKEERFNKKGRVT